MLQAAPARAASVRGTWQIGEGTGNTVTDRARSSKQSKRSNGAQGREQEAEQKIEWEVQGRGQKAKQQIS